MKSETKKIILTILNIAVVVANLIIKELAGGAEVITPVVSVALAFGAIA